MDLHQDQISIEFEWRWKNHSWNEPRPESVYAINLTNYGMGKNDRQCEDDLFRAFCYYKLDCVFIQTTSLKTLL